jgi:hypothetical protein
VEKIPEKSPGNCLQKNWEKHVVLPCDLICPKYLAMGPVMWPRDCTRPIGRENMFFAKLFTHPKTTPWKSISPKFAKAASMF